MLWWKKETNSCFFLFGKELGLYNIGIASLITIFTNTFILWVDSCGLQATYTSSLWVEQVLFFLEDDGQRIRSLVLNMLILRGLFDI